MRSLARFSAAAAAAGTAALLFAAPAQAEVVLLAVDGPDWDIPCSTQCTIRVQTTGEDLFEPVHFFIDGEAFGTATPDNNGGTEEAFAFLAWAPPELRTYTITAVQGESSRSITVTLPYDGEGNGSSGLLPTGSAG